ncbi:AcrR family transcriptional regulator [Mycobacterium frederiksbergense]|uniref:AcrR family transcriptional regulator n=1 Tax=Mycolicibacterium frederiksbergense TaxID=117567 RepID=A0ABT6L6H6_9MYCO|nr:TetR/AcrR family transcriptional regulator [Mycolicibacterium frederiksbergense]MDH6198211.1 AcrR family transcriptional regulator [Mycolicibacterium frederiksbergense]
MGEATASRAPTTARRRPRDRREQILHHAGELFASKGFHAVRMEDIAEAAGITARAIYRHFDNKQDLLSQVIIHDQNRVLMVLDPPAGPLAPGTKSLEGLLRRLVETSLDSARLGPLWQREARHLGAADFDRVRADTRRIGKTLCDAIEAADPGTTGFRAEMRAWAVVSIMASSGHFDSPLPRRRLADLLLSGALAVIRAPSYSASEGEGSFEVDKRNIARAATSRREQLIAAAAQAFRKRGFGGVGLDEFGIAGPAVYRYFDSKADILSTIILRLREWVALENMRALQRGVTDNQVIVELVRSYVSIATTATDLLAVSVTEPLNLPRRGQPSATIGF